MDPPGRPTKYKTINGDSTKQRTPDESLPNYEEDSGKEHLPARKVGKPPDYQLEDYYRLPYRLPYRSPMQMSKKDKATLPYRVPKRTERPIPPAPPRICDKCGMVLWTADDTVERSKQEGLCKASEPPPELLPRAGRPPAQLLEELGATTCPGEVGWFLKSLYREVGTVSPVMSKAVLQTALKRRWFDLAVDLLSDNRLGLSNINGLSQIFDHLNSKGTIRHVYPSVVRRALAEGYTFTHQDETAIRTLLEDTGLAMSAPELVDFWRRVESRIPSPSWETISLWIHHAGLVLMRAGWPNSTEVDEEREQLLQTVLRAIQNSSPGQWKDLMFPIGAFLGYWLKSWQNSAPISYVEDYATLRDTIPYLDEFLAKLDRKIVEHSLPHAFEWYATLTAKKDLLCLWEPKILWPVVCTISRTPLWHGTNGTLAKLERILDRKKKLEYYIRHRNDMELAINMARKFISGGLKDIRHGSRRRTDNLYDLAVIKRFSEQAHGQVDIFLLLVYQHFEAQSTPQTTLFNYIIRYFVQAGRYNPLILFLEHLPQPDASSISRRLLSAPLPEFLPALSTSLEAEIPDEEVELTPLVPTVPLGSPYKHPPQMLSIALRHTLSTSIPHAFRLFLLHPEPVSVARLVAMKISEASNCSTGDAMYGLRILLHLRESHLGRLIGLRIRGLYLYIASGLLLSFFPPRTNLGIWQLDTQLPVTRKDTGKQRGKAAFYTKPHKTRPASWSKDPITSSSKPASDSINRYKPPATPSPTTTSMPTLSTPVETVIPPEEIKKYFFLIARMMRNRKIPLGREMAMLLKRLIEECEARGVYMEPYLWELVRLWSMGKDWSGFKGNGVHRGEFWKGF
ncbi:hypothetical protein BJ508DRAFT_327197 [Ascobolus immersus RN42]|uniref:Uncharacterized protein n=1 Tax=Ascobolus immersus RN42 TaxID=1160509 RepID=A0A3N4IG79_ASCIM|nr:hypothetical protein BJ508DRAFT_327197 [Ascobolus immersus RN42]